MQLIYQLENILNAIATAILENEKQNRKDKAHYRDIKRRVEHILQHTISDRKLLKHLSIMVDERILQREDPSGKRGSKVHFRLTEKGKRKYRLKILGQEQVEKRKGLYLLLIFFETFKRRNLMSRRQLHQFLKQIGSSHNELKIIGKVNSLYSLDLGHSVAAFQPIKGVEIVRLDQPGSKKNPRTSPYYVVLPGFSIKEFTGYLELLKRRRDPRPFSKYSSAHEIPYVLYMDYSEQEVAEAIDSLKNDGIIRSIEEVFPGELRYNIADESLKHLIFGIWLVHIIDFQMLIARIVYEHKPTETDKQYLTTFLGNKATDRFLAYAYDFRRKRGSINSDKKQAIKKLEEDRTMLIQEIKKKHERLIRENEVVAEIIEGVCSSTVFHMIAPDGL